MFLRRFKILQDEKKEGEGGGGNDLSKQVSDLLEANKALMSRLEKLETKPNDPDKKTDDPDKKADLEKKARDERDVSDKANRDAAAIEAAIKFSLNSPKWIKDNEHVLSPEVKDIFKAAESEKYEGHVEKDKAIKAALIKHHFGIQANLDLLTPAVKTKLENWLKLTNTSRHDKAQEIYDDIFEPALARARDQKKAEALNKGFASSTDAQTRYKEKLISGSRKHYLGEKSDGT